MTKIKLQDKSNEDDDAGASEHYGGILPMSPSSASDSECDFHGSGTPNPCGKEASSEINEDSLWPHYTHISTERPEVSGAGMHSHPWMDIPAVSSQKDPISLVPKNMFGRSAAAVFHSPDLLEPDFESHLLYSSTQSGRSSIIVTDHQSGHYPSSSVDVGIEEVRRHFGNGLHLAGNLRSTVEPVTSAPSSVLERQDPPLAAHSPTNLTEEVNQGEIMASPIAGRAVPFVPGRSFDGSASLSEFPLPPEEPCLPTHSSTESSNVSMFSATRLNLQKIVEPQLEDSGAVDDFSRPRSTPSPQDHDTESDHEERGPTFRHSSKRSDKRKSSKIYQCPEPWCTATFTRSNDVTRHRLTAAIHKRANKDSSTCCQRCGEELSRPDARRRHELKGSCGKRKINRKPPHPLVSA